MADFQTRNNRYLVHENNEINNEIIHLKNEENKHNWRQYYKDKYKKNVVNS